MVSSALSVSAIASSNVGTAEYQGWLPELTDSRELNTTAIVSGKVFESGRKNPASGAAVHLVAQVDLNTGEIIKAMDVNLEINNPSAAKISGEPVQTDVDTGSISDSMNGVENSTTPTAFPNGCPTSGTKLVKNLGNRLVNVGSIHTATSAKLDNKFKTLGRLCGTHDKPNGSPRRLVMRSL